MTDTTPTVVLVSVWLAVACMPAGLVMRLDAARWGVWRIPWTLGAASFLVHTVSAYALVYDWSQAVAIEQTRRQTEAATGFDSGTGLYLNLLVAALWAFDAVTAWRPASRVRRRIARGVLVMHGFFAFMLFNGAFVFVNGPRRWFGLVISILFVALLGVAIRRSFRERKP